jgi:hypothetical protein
MSVNVRWNGRGWPGESAPEPRRITDRQRNKEHELEKRPTERYRKKPYGKKREWQFKKKKKKKKTYLLQTFTLIFNVFFFVWVYLK